MKKYRLGLYEKAMPDHLTWAEKLQAARNAGFDYLEMSVDESDARLSRLDMDRAEMDSIKAAVRAVGTGIGSICLSGHRKYPLGSADAATRCRSMDIMEKAIRLAEGLGIRTIQLAGYDVYYEESSEETRKEFLQNLHKAAEMASAAGVQMGFETMETPFMDTVGKAMRYVREVNSTYLGVYPDSGNITNAALLYGGDVAEDIRTGADHIVAVHLKETVPGKYREIPFGTGHVDFAKIVSAAWGAGVRRYVGEFWYKEGSDWQKELAYANTFLRSYLDMQE